MTSRRTKPNSYTDDAGVTHSVRGTSVYTGCELEVPQDFDRDPIVALLSPYPRKFDDEERHTTCLECIAMEGS